MAAKGGTEKSKAFASLIVGMVIGISIAGIVAWYLVQKNPASFHPPPVASELTKPEPQVVTPAPAPAAPAAAAQPQYEFYRVLPDKSESATAPVPKPAPSTRPTTAAPKPAGDVSPYLVQAGSFQRAEDAEKLKARLALAGFEASIQSVNIPDKGLWHRVRLGPYKGLSEANAAIASLKSNGITTATAVRAQ